MITPSVANMWHCVHDRWVLGLSWPKIVAFHSANVRSRWTPAGVTTSWHEPHICDDSGALPSSSGERSLRWAGLATGLAIAPRMTSSSASVIALL